MDENLKKSMKTIVGISNQLGEKLHSWFQYILLPASSLFGILIALHGRSSDILHIRLFFALAIVALALGILLIAIATYSHIEALRRLRKNYEQEAITALREHRGVGHVGASERKIFLFCEKAGYAFLILSVLLLAVYVLLSALCCC